MYYLFIGGIFGLLKPQFVGYTKSEGCRQHGRRQRGARGPCLPRIFKHGANIVDRGLKVLFFDLFCYFRSFFPLPPSPWKIFCRRPW